MKVLFSSVFFISLISVNAQSVVDKDSVVTVEISLNWMTWDQLIDSTRQAYRTIDKDSIVLQARLVNALSHPPGCGNLAFALVQQFQITEASAPFKIGQYILLIERCPEFLKHGFFVTDALYKVEISLNSGAPFNYALSGFVAKENFPIFWSKRIERLK